MEHRLIQGGEQFLPFARSRITNLKKLGLPYANQSFEIDGVSIKVRIQPGHEYIRIEGGGIMSGVVKDGEPTTTPPVVLNKFKPTKKCWNTVMRHKPTGADQFAGSERLAKTAAKNQYGVLAASSFSGLLAGAVQNMLGGGAEVKYSSSFEKTHGVMRAADGKLWLVEVSRVNGVIAMPFGLKQDGVPVGAMFPAGANLITAIETGAVLRLASAESLADVYAKTPYAAYLGWSFNADGSEAHATCYRRQPCSPADAPYIATLTFPDTFANTGDQVDGFHYRLTLSPTSATLTEVSSGRIIGGSGYGAPELLMYDATGVAHRVLFQSFSVGAPAGQIVSDTTILVTHHAGATTLTKLVYSGGGFGSLRKFTCGPLPVAMAYNPAVDVFDKRGPTPSIVYPKVTASPPRKVYLHSESCRDAVMYSEMFEGVAIFTWTSDAQDVATTDLGDWYAFYQDQETGVWSDGIKITTQVQAVVATEGSGRHTLEPSEIRKVLWPDGRITDDSTPPGKALDTAITGWLGGFAPFSLPTLPVDSVTTSFALTCSMSGPKPDGVLPRAVLSAPYAVLSGVDTVGGEDVTRSINFIGSVGGGANYPTT